MLKYTGTKAVTKNALFFQEKWMSPILWCIDMNIKQPTDCSVFIVCHILDSKYRLGCGPKSQFFDKDSLFA